MKVEKSKLKMRKPKFLKIDNWELQIQRKQQKGQALITLLFFVIIGVTIISAAVIVILTNSLSGSRMEQGFGAYAVAEAGIENALLRLDRNPYYTGETLSVGNGTATITVSGNNLITILSVGTLYNAVRKVQATVTNNNNAFTVTAWKEVY